MSLRSQRCLLAVAITGWVGWAAAFANGMTTEFSGHNLLAHNAALSIAVTFTTCWVIVSTISPVIATNRALLSTKPLCPGCLAKKPAVEVVPVQHQMIYDYRSHVPR